MFEIEDLIVDQEFVGRKDTYNIKLGGLGGWDYVNSKKSHGDRSSQAYTMLKKMKLDKSGNERRNISRSNKMKALWADPEYKSKMSNKFKCDWTGRMHSPESKAKMSLAAKNRKPEQNSQFGKMWIFSE